MKSGTQTSPFWSKGLLQSFAGKERLGISWGKLRTHRAKACMRAPHERLLLGLRSMGHEIRSIRSQRTRLISESGETISLNSTPSLRDLPSSKRFAFELSQMPFGAAVKEMSTPMAVLSPGHEASCA